MAASTVQATETTSEQKPIDSKTIREAYDGVLWVPRLPAGKQLDVTCEALAGHLGVLIPEAMGIAARMRSGMRQMAVHCLVRAHQALALDPGPGPRGVREVWAYDLAIAARALLTLVENPGPLGKPTGEDEIERAVRRKICGGCCQTIEYGEGFEETAFAAEASGGIRGYRHTDSCTVVAAERRELMAVAGAPAGTGSGGASGDGDAAMVHR
jgi:hypothetical protein